MATQKDSWRQIATYLLLVFGLSSVFYLLVLKAHTLGAAGGLYVLGIMWCPALAGMATLRLNGRNLNGLGWRWPATGYAAKSWLIPLLYAFIAYVVVWTTGRLDPGAAQEAL
jgi:CAAX protease family protein